MMKPRSKEEVLEFIADISCPIGPIVFAGFGSNYQKRLMEEPLCFDEIIYEWLSESEAISLLQVLIEIACCKKLDQRFECLRLRFWEDWEHTIINLLFELTQENEPMFEEVMAQLGTSEPAQRIVSELRSWWDEQA